MASTESPGFEHCEALAVPEPSVAILMKSCITGKIGTQFEIARHHLHDLPIDQVFSQGLIGTKMASSHSPLAPTILRDTVALFPGTSLEKGSLRVPNLDGAPDWQPDDAVTQISEAYGELDKSKTVNLFFSAGWDSRVELAFLLQHFDSTQIILFHLYENDESLSVVREIAKTLSLELRTFRAEEVRETAFSQLPPSLWDRLLEEPFWRPTIPTYGSLLAGKGINDIFLGFTPWELKGRYASQLPPHPPEDTSTPLWRLRLIRPSREVVGTAERGYAINHQVDTWRRALTVTSDLRDDIRQDFANWALSYGFSYSMRMRALAPLGLTQIQATWNCTVPFWRLERRHKEGTNFIKFVLESLDPDLLGAAVISSSETAAGGLSSGTNWLENILRSIVTNQRNEVGERGIRKIADSSVIEMLSNVGRNSPSKQTKLTALQIEGFIYKCLVD